MSRKSIFRPLADIIKEGRSREEWLSDELRQILDALPIFVFVAEDPDCRFIFGNRMSETLFRAPRGANFSKSAPEAAAPRTYELLDMAGRPIPIEECPLHRAAGGEEIFGCEFQVRFSDGQCFSAIGNAVPLRDETGQVWGAVGAFQVVTTQKEAVAKLRESEEQLKLFIDHAPAAIAMFDNEMRYKAVSRRFVAEYAPGSGLDPASLVGRSHYDVFPDLPERWRACHRRVLTGETISVEDDQFLHKDGRIDWLRWEMVPWYDSEGLIGGALLFTEVITVRKEAEKAMALAKADMERAAEAQSRFFAAASHDLRQPFQAIRLFFDVLDQSAPPGQRLVMDRLAQSITAAEDLLNQLLDIARLESGSIKLVPADVDLARLVADLKAELEPIAARKGLSLRTAGPTVVIRTDPLILKRILFNIAANAINYTERGGVLVGIRRRRLCVQVEIWDTGIGIAKDHAEAVFEEFYQVHNSARDRTKGVGLGLAIVKRLCGLLGAEVTFSSRLGRGTVFRVRFALPDTGEERSG